MGPSLRDHPTLGRPATRERPSTREHGDHSLIIPSRTSSLHSRITQPPASAFTVKENYKTPKTLTHAYMVCGIAREPSHWVKAPSPAQGRIAHSKGATGQFWLPEILGSSPRLEQDNEMARALYAAMRVRVRTGRVRPALTEPGVFPSRCGGMHGSRPAELRASFVCSSARFIPHPLRDRLARLVATGSEADRKCPGDAEKA